MTKMKTIGVLAAGVFVGAFAKGLQDIKLIEEGQEVVGKLADKGVDKIKAIVNKTEINKKVDTEDALVRFQTFYARTAQFGSYSNLGLEDHIPEDFEFNSYAEAKVNMIKETIPEKLSEKQKDELKELYSLIMDYGVYVNEALNNNVEQITKTVDAQEVEITK